MTPVMPPMRKITSPPIPKASGARHTGLPAQSVVIHPNTWIPLGMAINMLAAAKKPMPTGESPLVNMWCTHSPKLMNAVASRATTMSV